MQFGFQKDGSTDNLYSAITGWSLDLWNVNAWTVQMHELYKCNVFTWSFCMVLNVLCTMYKKWTPNVGSKITELLI
jgi:hypothetical protein